METCLQARLYKSRRVEPTTIEETDKVAWPVYFKTILSRHFVSSGFRVCKNKLLNHYKRGFTTVLLPYEREGGCQLVQVILLHAQVQCNA